MALVLTAVTLLAVPAAAAVISLLIVAPRKVPCDQLKASLTSGTV